MSHTLLALETSTHACSVALTVNGQVLQHYQVAARQHGALLLPWVQDLLGQARISLAQVDAIAVSRGPGAFTGVRIGIAAAQGLALAAQKPVVAVSSLAACAHGAWRKTGLKRHLVAFDARMGEWYWGQALVQGQGQVLLQAEAVVAPERVLWPQQGGWLAVSDGWQAYPEVHHGAAALLVDSNDGLDCLPSAVDVLAIAEHELSLGRQISAAELQPLYLRDNVAAKPKTKT